MKSEVRKCFSGWPRRVRKVFSMANAEQEEEQTSTTAATSSRSSSRSSKRTLYVQFTLFVYGAESVTRR